MQLTRGGWSRVETSLVGNKVMVDQGEVVRPSQLIASVGRTFGRSSTVRAEELVASSIQLTSRGRN
jgi:hypothetical protein